MLLKRFVDETGHLFLFSRRESGGTRKTKIENAFLERHLYSETDRAGLRSTWLEKQLGILEGLTDPVIQKILDAARSDRLPQLTSSERKIWDYFFITQFKRVPEFFRSSSNLDAANRRFAEIIADLKSRYPAKVQELDEMSDEASDFIGRGQLHALSSVSARVMDAMALRSLAVVKVGPPCHAFAIGSRPVLQLGGNGTWTIHNEATEMWLPVASGVLVGIGSKSVSEELRTLNDPKMLGYVNEVTAKESVAFASRSKMLTASLASTP